MTSQTASRLRQNNDISIKINNKRYPFSINLDECNSNANKRILTVLVSYYSKEDEKVLVN